MREPEEGMGEPDFHLPLHRIVQSCIRKPVTHPKILQLFRNLRICKNPEKLHILVEYQGVPKVDSSASAGQEVTTHLFLSLNLVLNNSRLLDP